jgi:GTP pyrophosphokinase
VRRLLEPQETADTDRDFLERMRTELFEDRVYALTPKGEVVDLPRGATPLDFAYHVHTDLGHRCRGAKVNGRIVPLDHQVSNGEIIEIITGKHPAPSRDWLAPEQGYLISPRNRSKVRAWFRKLDVSDNRSAGRQIAERELARLGVKADRMSALVQELKANDLDHFHQLLGEGEITVTQLVQAAERLMLPAEEPGPRMRRAPKAAAAKKKRGSLVEIEGVGDLPITLARCCAPIRPQAISGYVTLGRGVTIHRSDCPALARMRAVKPERALNVEWSSDHPENLEVQIDITAYDRRGFVRDISDVMAVEHLSIDALNTVTDHDNGTAHMTVRLAVKDLEQLARVLRRLAGVPNVISARRVH